LKFAKHSIIHTLAMHYTTSSFRKKMVKINSEKSVKRLISLKFDTIGAQKP